MDKAEDYSTTGRWVVTTCTLQGSTENDEKMSSHFDGIILCLGFFSVPHIPHIPGLMQEFKGTVRHVGSYRNPQPFRGRTVIVVGEFDWVSAFMCRGRTVIVVGEFDWVSVFMCRGRTVIVVSEFDWVSVFMYRGRAVTVVGEFDWVSAFMCRDRTVIVFGEF